jgi:polyisoprenoid-binding protein YceI
MPLFLRWTASVVLALAALAMTPGHAYAAPVNYKIDPDHTYPSFEADHLGVSTFRGKMDHTTGSVVLDKAAGTGSVDVTIDLSSIDFGLKSLNIWAQGKDLFDVQVNPTATYKGRIEFANGTPAQVVGDLTLHGITQHVNLKINAFKCVPHPLFRRELCGADAITTIRRDQFGLDAGKDYGFNMDVLLRIQVEAIAAE